MNYAKINHLIKYCNCTETLFCFLFFLGGEFSLCRLNFCRWLKIFMEANDSCKFNSLGFKPQAIESNFFLYLFDLIIYQLRGFYDSDKIICSYPSNSCFFIHISLYCFFIFSFKKLRSIKSIACSFLLLKSLKLLL